MEAIMKKSLLLVAVSAVFMFLSCGNGADFDPIDLGACIYEDPAENPAIVMKDKIYPETQTTPLCHDYLEVTKKEGKVLNFEWYGNFPCGDDWEFGYEINDVKDNILEVTIKQHDKDPNVTAKCVGCCHVMPMVYEGKSEEEIAAIKGIKVSYKEHNYEVTFEF
jgi:hypothetical protein